jgi:acyl-coenzyme A synthetase/AMP-(fatty) acid ligase
MGLPIINTKKSYEKPEAVGYALPAYEVSILDEKLEPLPNNTIGQLAIKGKGMFDGYLSPPTKRHEVLQNGYFLTGDYALREDDGLIIIKGRIKSVINVSGNKVFPDEIENVVNTYPTILASKAYSKQHPLLGEVVALDIMLKENAQINVEDLRNYCKKNLSTFKLPQYINVVEKIEMTDSGKIKR